MIKDISNKSNQNQIWRIGYRQFTGTLRSCQGRYWITNRIRTGIHPASPSVVITAPRGSSAGPARGRWHGPTSRWHGQGHYFFPPPSYISKSTAKLTSESTEVQLHFASLYSPFSNERPSESTLGKPPWSWLQSWLWSHSNEKSKCERVNLLFEVDLGVDNDWIALIVRCRTSILRISKLTSKSTS